MNPEIINLFSTAAALWIAISATVYIVHQPSGKKLAWLPVRLLRKAVGGAFVALGRWLGGR